MAISFGGLATGLDTTALIEGIMAADRKPIERLQTDREYQSARLEAYGVFDGALNSLLTQANLLESDSSLLAKKSSFTGESLVSASTTTSAAIEGSYQIRSFTFAQVEKEVSQGYASTSASEFGTGTLSITIGTTTPVTHDITIDGDNNSLTGIANAINDAGIGIKAAIINDGTDTPYRLVLTGNTAGKAAEVGFTIDTSALTGGTYANPAFTETQGASQAHIQVDGIDMYSDSNVFADAIPGVTLSVDQADNGATSSTLTITHDQTAITSKVKGFVAAYNMVMAFVSDQSSTNGETAGILAGDSGMNAIKRRIQNLLTTPISNSGSYSSLAEFGLKTQKDGTLAFDESKLTAAIGKDLDGVVTLLAGDDTTEGIASRFQSYLEGVTDKLDGFLIGREQSIDRNIDRIDSRIAQMEARLTMREQTLRDQFTAMEEMVSALNAQSDYLSQQMSMLENLWRKK